ncbi:unnamed protein product, partial [Prorocentrum cordatum]
MGAAPTGRSEAAAALRDWPRLLSGRRARSESGSAPVDSDRGGSVRPRQLEPARGTAPAVVAPVSSPARSALSARRPLSRGAARLCRRLAAPLVGTLHVSPPREAQPSPAARPPAFPPRPRGCPRARARPRPQDSPLAAEDLRGPRAHRETARGQATGATRDEGRAGGERGAPRRRRRSRMEREKPISADHARGCAPAAGPDAARRSARVGSGSARGPPSSAP